jgi:hypothetical protein
MGAYESGGVPTLAVVSRFTVEREGRGPLFRWRVAQLGLAIGFTLWGEV